MYRVMQFNGVADHHSQTTSGGTQLSPNGFFSSEEVSLKLKLEILLP
jgi:hypothetical protein